MVPRTDQQLPGTLWWTVTDRRKLVYGCKLSHQLWTSLRRHLIFHDTGPSNIAQYQGTLPNSICETIFAQCRIANPGSDTCKTCGTLEPSDVPAATASTLICSSTSPALDHDDPNRASLLGREGINHCFLNLRLSVKHLPIWTRRNSISKECTVSTQKKIGTKME